MAKVAKYAVVKNNCFFNTKGYIEACNNIHADIVLSVGDNRFQHYFYNSVLIIGSAVKKILVYWRCYLFRRSIYWKGKDLIWDTYTMNFCMGPTLQRTFMLWVFFETWFSSATFLGGAKVY